MAPTDEKFLPKEPLDLPTEPLDLPREPLDLPTGNKEDDEPIYGMQTLFSWHAPGRPFRKRGKQYYLTSLLIMLLVQIILFLFSQYALMGVVLALVFVAFVLATTPPRDFHYKISEQGVTIEDHFFLWQELYDFYFKKIEGVKVLHLRTLAFLPGVLTIPLGDTNEEDIKSILVHFLPYREVVRETFMEKAADWLSRNFPLEKPNQLAS